MRTIALIYATLGTLFGAAAHVWALQMGPDMVAFFGAPPSVVGSVVDGTLLAPISIYAIAGLLVIISLYALSALGWFVRLPFLRTVMWVLAAVFIVRGLLVIPSLG
jgi:hypothetical protein